MSSLRLENVKKSYGENAVLHEISLSVAAGEFIVVVGPSGCGKSSLLRMVAGLESVSAGDIYIHDRLVTNVEPALRDIAMVFQNYALYPHMSVFDNMAYGLRMRKIAKAEIAIRVEQVSALLQLSDFLQRKPHELSGGQRQRVAMGRAIVRQPEVFLFDEPLSNLDAKLRMEMRLEIKKLHKRLGITSLYVTHDQTEAMTLADRVMVLNQGRVEQLASPATIYHQPQTQFVASFMGDPVMNFFTGHISQDAKHIKLQGGYCLSCVALKRQYLVNKPVIVGLRAEALTIQADGGFGFNVAMVEALGADCILHGELDSGETMVVRVAFSGRYKIGMRLNLGVSAEAVHLFDCDTGRRID